MVDRVDGISGFLFDENLENHRERFRSKTAVGVSSFCLRILATGLAGELLVVENKQGKERGSQLCRCLPLVFHRFDSRSDVDRFRNQKKRERNELFFGTFVDRTVAWTD